VRVNNSAADIRAVSTWPEEAHYTRFDLRIPPNTPRGLAWIDVSVRGVSGPAVEFAVR